MKIIGIVFLMVITLFPVYATAYYKKYASIFSTIDSYGVIQSLTDDIQVNTDGSLDVTETITLQNPDNFQRTVFIRFFPYEFDIHLLIWPKYLIKTISCNNNLIENDNAVISVYENHYGVAIEQANVGLTVYKIQYHDYFGIKIRKNDNQFIWQLDNVNLAMPIQYIEYNVTFPKGVKLISYRALLNTSIANDTSYVMQQETRNNQDILHFNTTRSIQYPEQLSILVSLQKGVFQSAFTWSNILTYLTPPIYYAYVISLLWFFFVVWYFSNLLKKFSPNLTSQAIYSCSPPDNLSPYEIAYMSKTSNRRFLLTYITNLLIKRYFIFDLTLKKYVYQDKSIDELPEGEKFIANRLLKFPDRNLYYAMTTTLLKNLKRNINKFYFYNKLRFIWLIVTFCLLGLIAYSMNVILYPNHQGIGRPEIMLGWRTLGMYVGFGLIFLIFSDFRYLLKALPKKYLAFNIIFFIGLALILYNFYLLLYFYPVSYFLPLMVLAYPNFLCVRYASILNLQGKNVYQRILGFKDYLRKAEFALTADEFEKYLPYAIAFNIENEWAEKFKSIYPQQYNPEWIIHKKDKTHTLPELIKDFVNSFEVVR